MNSRVTYDNKIDGIAMVPVVIWGLFGLAFLWMTFKEAWYYLPIAAIVLSSVYMLYNKKPWALVIMTALCVFAILQMIIADHIRLWSATVLTMWLPLLTWLTTFKQIDYAALFQKRKHAMQYQIKDLADTAYGGRPSGTYHGSLSEPYCSQACHDNGGLYVLSTMLQNQTGVCGFCQRPVKASMYGIPECAAIPFEGKTLFVCTACVDKAKLYMSSYQKCCMCQKNIEPDILLR